ncbi:MAG: hypothetical protein OET79_15810, partial [Nitrospirota bacterium]|nr:hypothetical protein [Nitrospirota bacterium]
CVIEDVEIYGEFDIGIHGLPGSGGSVTNVTITGGNIGIRQNLCRPSPSIQSVTLIGQKQYGIKLDQSRGPLVVSGFEIVGPRDGSDQYRAIWLQSREIDADPATANLVLSDGTIEVFGEGPAIENFDQDMYLRNVYVNAELIASSGAKHSPVEELGGKAGAWTKVGAYMFINGSDGTLATLDGESFGTQGEDREYRDDIAIVDAPPDDLVSRHSWDQSTFPTYFDGAVIDVVKDYGVTRDDNGDDDAPLINQALRDSVTPGHPHSGKPVFLPRGHFHIASTVTVPAGAS